MSLEEATVSKMWEIALLDASLRCSCSVYLPKEPLAVDNYCDLAVTLRCRNMRLCTSPLQMHVSIVIVLIFLNV